MQHASGIVAGKDGTYYYATLTHRKSGWTSGAVRRLRSAHLVRAILQVSGQTCLGVSAHWTSAASKIGLPHYFTSVAEKSPVVACVDSNTLEQMTKEFGECATALVPDDAFLATLPLLYASLQSDSFGSIYQTPDRFIVGIVRRRVLTSVYSLPSTSVDALRGMIERIGRFEHSLFAGKPEQPVSIFYCIGADSLSSDKILDECGDGVTFVGLALPRFIDTADEAAVRAIGCAAAQMSTTAIPQFVFSPVSARLSGMRQMIYRAALVFAAAAIIGSLGAWCFKWIADTHHAQARQKFESAIVHDPQIGKLVNTNDSLLQQLSDIKSGSTASTRWTEVLNLLDSLKPVGLFFENMATEPGRTPQSCDRIAVSGRAPNSATVYDLVDKLHKQSLFAQIAVSSVEQVKDAGDIVQFKIIGTLTCQNP